MSMKIRIREPEDAPSTVPPIQMDAETARRLFFQGGTFIFLDFPINSEFGIDYNSWTTGEKFKGVKMIPPGVHFIYFSSSNQDGQRAPRIGWFHDFKETEIYVKKWDKINEDIFDADVSEEEIDQFRDNLTNMDQYLAAYPYENYKTWFSLSEHIRKTVVDKLQPLNNRITSQSQLVSKEYEDCGEAGQRVDKNHPTRLRYFDEQGLPIMHLLPGTEIRFSKVDLNHTSMSTSVGLDASDVVNKLLGEIERPEDLLGELQFAFVCFLMGHVYEGFEKWKRFVHLLCSCRRALTEHEDFYMKFLMVLHFQLKLTPRDFFVDIVTKNNFLTITLTNFFTNVETTPDVGRRLKDKSSKFKNYLSKYYKWNFDSTPDDCLPLVVT